MTFLLNIVQLHKLPLKIIQVERKLAYHALPETGYCVVIFKTVARRYPPVGIYFRHVEDIVFPLEPQYFQVQVVEIGNYLYSFGNQIVHNPFINIHIKIWYIL
jgi:hypothetical protein